MSVRAASEQASVASPSEAEKPRTDAAFVSVLLTTLPAGRLRHRDVARLDALLRRMELTLARKSPEVDVASLSRRLRRLAESAARRPVRRGLGLFVGGDTDRMVTLPQPVFDRVVVDSYFDERDVMVAEQFSPAFRVVVVRHGFAQLYDSRADDTLVEQRDRFPITTEQRDRTAFYDEVARAVAEADAEDPRPCVLASDDAELRSKFDALVPSSAGVLGASASWMRTDVVHRLARRQVADHRAEIARAAIPEAGARGWTVGLRETKAVVEERPHGLLLVEQNFNDIPPRGIQVVSGKSTGRRAGSLNASISRVAAAGGTVMFVEDRDLLDWGGVTYRPMVPIE